MNIVSTEAEIHAFITARIMSRLSLPGERRSEALREVLKLTHAHLDTQRLESMIALAPEIPLPLYAKWVGLFADRLLETVQREQLQDLCANSEESNATLLLLYSMFMESERMECLAREDLKTLNRP
ncbi:MAG: hypothetical protein FWG04_04805 [Desulfovibrionaceae bacterium]|nr:hypothetical protein [Desulfovibrionaceae bacterium]